MQTKSRFSCFAARLSLITLLGNSSVAIAQATIDGGQLVTIPGSQTSPWNVGGDLIIGDTATGTLEIATGGSVLNADAYIGNNLGSSGTVTVSGVGATWQNTGDLYMGYSGNGTLNITNGGYVSSADAAVGFLSGSNGNTLVAGSGTRWDNDNIYIGYNGTGSLTIAEGAVVAGRAGFIGTRAGGVGTMLVTGEQSRWESAASAYVGYASNSSGKLIIADGGYATNTWGVIGNASNATGVVLVTGMGSNWNVVDDVTVGNIGTGSLIIADNGVVSTVNSVDGIKIAQSAGSSGVLVIGAAEGEAPVNPGWVETDSIKFGNGNGKILFNHASNNYLFDSNFTGVGLVGNGLVEAIAGRTIFNANHDNFTGSFQISGSGILQLNGNLSGRTADILAGGTLEGNGIIGNTVNAGTIAPGASIGTLTIAGDYSGNGGTLALEAVLGGDASASDKLVITGNATGNTKVLIHNLGGTGAKTINGIKVIDIGGVSDDQAFTQEGRIVAGAYDYTLVKGNQSGADPQSWFLVSGAIRPEVGGYLGVIEHNQSTFNHSFHDRQQLLDTPYQSSWARVEYTHNKSKAGEHNSLSNKTDRTLLHFGSDLFEKNRLHLGLMGAYSRGEIKTDSNQNIGNTKSTSDGYSVGVYGTWFHQNKDQGGLYVDSYAQYNWFDNEVKGSHLSSESFRTSGITVSAETGYGFALGQTGSVNWMLEPQVQVIYNNYDGKDHTETNGTRIQSRQSDDTIGRVGIRLQGKSETIQPFVTLNYWTHSSQASISMDNVNVESNRARNIAEVKVGGQMKVNDHVQLFAQLQGSTGSDSTSGYGGNVGVTANW